MVCFFLSAQHLVSQILFFLQSGNLREMTTGAIIGSIIGLILLIILVSLYFIGVICGCIANRRAAKVKRREDKESESVLKKR